MGKLDKTRSYGVVIGDPNIAYEQDGFHYKSDGSEIGAWTTKENLQNERYLAEKRKQQEAKYAARRERIQQQKRIAEDA